MKRASPWIQFAILFGFSFVVALVLLAIAEATGLAYLRFAAGGALLVPFAVAGASRKQRTEVLDKAQRAGHQCARCEYEFKSHDPRFDYEGYCVCAECEKFLSKAAGAPLPLFRSRDAREVGDGGV